MPYDKQILDKSIEALQIPKGLSLDEITNIYNQMISKQDIDLDELSDAFEYIKKYHNMYIGVDTSDADVEIGEEITKTSIYPSDDEDQTKEIEINTDDQISIDDHNLVDDTRDKKDYKQSSIENDILWMIVIILTVTVILHILRHEFGLI